MTRRPGPFREPSRHKPRPVAPALRGSDHARGTAMALRAATARALGTAASVRERAQLTVARIGAAVKRTAYASSLQCCVVTYLRISCSHRRASCCAGSPSWAMATGGACRQHAWAFVHRITSRPQPLSGWITTRTQGGRAPARRAHRPRQLWQHVLRKPALLNQCVRPHRDVIASKKFLTPGERAADRERWVMYADKDDYTPTEVPPDWHGANQRRRSVL